MQREYLLQGLNCANCAAKIENDIKGMSQIHTASLNFVSTTLKTEIAGNYRGNITSDIEKIVHKYEPDIAVIEKDRVNAPSHTNRKKKSGWWEQTARIAGVLLFGAGVLLQGRPEVFKFAVPAIFLLSYFLLGGDIILRAVRNLKRGLIFDENFLMCIATVGAFLIGNYPEAVAVMLFYQIGEYFQNRAIRQSKKSITELMDIRPDFANLIKDGQIEKVPPEVINIGDRIMVKPGEKIPLDGIVLAGESVLDMRALTGESVPRRVSRSDTVLSGCINQNGVLTIEAAKRYAESTAARMIDLVENAGSKKAPTENFITTFSKYYTPAVVILAALISGIPPLLLGGSWPEWIHRGLIFLVISCPCALVISIPLGFFGGIGAASGKGILVKGGNYLEALNNLDIIVFDKTGTLTKGVFEVTAVHPAGNFTKADVLELAAKAEACSNHPIALSIAEAYGKKIDKECLSDYQERSGYGISVKAAGKRILAGNAKLMEKERISFTEPKEVGTRIYIAVEREYAGAVVIADAVKADSSLALQRLREKGIRKAVMFTGDNQAVAESIAGELKLDAVYAGLLPDQKVEALEKLEQEKRSKGKLAFVGDGINDAPVLARADIGIAMGGLGSDAAIEAADIVLMTDEPSKIAEAIEIAKGTKRIVLQNIVFALGVKGVFLILGAFELAAMWEAVFADVGVSVLAILNAMRVMRFK